MANFDGDSGDDNYTGTEDADIINGNGGNDTLNGTGGDDVVHGNGGDDILYGGDGLDQLFGDNGTDTMLIDAAGQIVSGELYNGGGGTDTLVLNFNSDGDLSGITMTGIESLFQSYFSWDTRLTLLQFNAFQSIAGQSFTLTSGGTVDMAGKSITASVINLANNNTSFSLAGVTQGYLLTINGGTGNDTITGWTNIDTLNGGGGADELRGHDGDDLLDGGTGDDELRGQNGNDTLWGQIGADTLLGQAGDDVLDGGDGNDVLRGGADNDNISGGAGDDTIFGDTGKLTADGGDGNDTITGGASVDTLAGGEGNDSLNGEAANDTLSGGDGNDILRGNEGRDVATGGAGADTFRFNALAEFQGNTTAKADVITDFSRPEGDRIVLNAIDAIPGGANDAFAFIGAAAFGGIEGQLRYQQIGGNTYVMGDVDGDSVEDFMIRLDGLHTLVAGDFVL
jgi:Ca2+-binding RTX toxin-like protein